MSTLSGCAGSTKHYALIEQSLRAGDPQRADAILEQAAKRYDDQSRVQYWMDRGMTLHLAGRYRDSNVLLQQAEDEIDRLYTRRIRIETTAFLSNDTALPYEGDPHERVLVNVVKALNYALLGARDEALVECRRIDHQLNLLADRAAGRDAYRDDGFARYLTAVLYEDSRDLSNAFIAYRKAYEAYRVNRAWARTPMPSSLPADLLRVTAALHLTQEHETYRQAFPAATWESLEALQDRAHLVVISYNGRAPRKEDMFIDLPVSPEALQLVLVTKGVTAGSGESNRAAETILYGISGQVVRVALPKLVSQKTDVTAQDLTLSGSSGTFRGAMELTHNVTANAEKALQDRFFTIAMKAVARASVKYAMAEGATHGARAMAGTDNAGWVGLVVGILAKMAAVASEEADKRSWRTLPDEIRMGRLWVPPGDYEVTLRSNISGRWQEGVQRAHLDAGRTTFLVQRVVQ